MRNFLCSLALLSVIACQGPPETVDPIKQGLVTYTNTFATGSAALQAVAGNVSCGYMVTCPLMLFWRSTDGYCEWHWMSASVGPMDNDYVFYAGNASWAYMIALGATQSTSIYCANTGTTVSFVGLNQGTHYLQLHGTPQADAFNCTGTYTLGCYGYGGNDIFDDADNVRVTMDGGDGDDKIRAQVLGVGSIHPSLWGGAGNDCLYSRDTAADVQCGSGSDISNVSGTSCETVTSTTCP